MQKFAIFVDGSNLDGVLKHLRLRVDDYGSFYRYIFEQAVTIWGRSFAQGAPWPTAQLSRVYWYVVGKIDEWDLDDPRSEEKVRRRFEMNERIRGSFTQEVLSKNPELNEAQAFDAAWRLAFDDTRGWYNGRRDSLEKKKRFYHGVQAQTDFVEVRQSGHWKVDLLHNTVNEKGLDTSLAVDMVALSNTYDVVLLISGDADSIPGIEYIKDKSKTVGVVELRKGAPGEEPSKGSSSRLKIVADFVVQIFESDLLRRQISYQANMPDRAEVPY